MARRKRKITKRRRRVSGVGAALNANNPLVALVAVAAGYYMADSINAMTDKVIPASVLTATDAKKYIAPGGKLALGGYLAFGKKPSMLRSIPTILLKGAGGLLAGAGLKQTLVKAGVVSGYQSVPVLGKRRMGGYQQTPVIGGTPAQLQGYTPAGSGVGKVPGQLQGYLPSGSGVGVMGGIGNANGYGAPGSGITSTSSGDYMN